MRVLVNGVRLFFDVEGPGLAVDGGRMAAKPTLLLLHGGPGADHSIYKPYFQRFSDVVQVVSLDHRGNGRSDPASPETWNLAQWADDVRGFCEALGIERPIVYGASFGGMVAMAYATRHLQHPAGLVLVSTEAWGPGDPRAGLDHEALARVMRRPEVTQWFTRPDGESRSFNFLSQLDRVRCPTLVMGGKDDPMTPIQGQREIAAALAKEVVQFDEFENCGHGVVADVPDRAEALMRAFIAKAAGG